LNFGLFSSFYLSLAAIAKLYRSSADGRCALIADIAADITAKTKNLIT
jgi:hypothetical protein